MIASHTSKIAVLENVASGTEETFEPPNVEHRGADHPVPVAFGPLIWPVLTDLGISNVVPPAKPNHQVTPTGGVAIKQLCPVDNTQGSVALAPKID